MQEDAKVIIFSDLKDRSIDFQTHLLREYGIECDFFAVYDNQFELIRDLKKYHFCIFLVSESWKRLYYYLGACDGLEKRYLIFSQQDVYDPITSQRLISFVDFTNKAWFKKRAIDIAITHTLQSTDQLPQVTWSEPDEFDSKRLQALRKRLSYAKSESELEVILSEILAKQDIIFNRDLNIEKTKLKPDFMIWSGDLEYIIGNPIIIELRRQAPKSADIENILNYMSSTDAALSIILYHNLAHYEVGVDLLLPEQSDRVAIGDVETFINDVLSLGFKDATLRTISG